MNILSKNKGEVLIWMFILDALMRPNFQAYIRWTGNVLEFVILNGMVLFTEFQKVKWENQKPTANDEDPGERWKNCLISKNDVKNRMRGVRSQNYKKKGDLEEDSNKPWIEKAEGLNGGYVFTTHTSICQKLGMSFEEIQKYAKAVGEKYNPSTANGTSIKKATHSIRNKKLKLTTGVAPYSGVSQVEANMTKTEVEHTKSMESQQPGSSHSLAHYDYITPAESPVNGIHPQPALASLYPYFTHEGAQDIPVIRSQIWGVSMGTNEFPALVDQAQTGQNSTHRNSSYPSSELNNRKGSVTQSKMIPNKKIKQSSLYQRRVGRAEEESREPEMYLEGFGSNAIYRATYPTPLGLEPRNPDMLHQDTYNTVNNTSYRTSVPEFPQVSEKRKCLLTQQCFPAPQTVYPSFHNSTTQFHQISSLEVPIQKATPSEGVFLTPPNSNLIIHDPSSPMMNTFHSPDYPTEVKSPVTDFSSLDKQLSEDHIVLQTASQSIINLKTQDFDDFEQVDMEQLFSYILY